MNPELTAAAEKAAYERGRRDELASVIADLEADCRALSAGKLMIDRLQHEAIVEVIGHLKTGKHRYTAPEAA